MSCRGLIEQYRDGAVNSFLVLNTDSDLEAFRDRITKRVPACHDLVAHGKACPQDTFDAPWLIARGGVPGDDREHIVLRPITHHKDDIAGDP